MIETGKPPNPEVEAKMYAASRMDVCAREQTAREILTDHIEQLQTTVRQLQALLGALPAELPHQADRALKRILRPDKF